MSYIGTKPADSILSSADIQDGAISTVDLADASITQAKLASGVAGTGPAFAANSTNGQTLSTNTATKIQFNSEEYDTNSCYDNATNYRFTPTVAGYYQVNAGIGINAVACGITIAIYKNGSAYKRTGQQAVTSEYNNGSLLVYLNGSTDYIEIYGSLSIGQALSASGTTTPFFQAFLVRAA